jgi:hypothetical protein
MSTKLGRPRVYEHGRTRVYAYLRKDQKARVMRVAKEMRLSASDLIAQALAATGIIRR